MRSCVNSGSCSCLIRDRSPGMDARSSWRRTTRGLRLGCPRACAALRHPHGRTQSLLPGSASCPVSAVGLGRCRHPRAIARGSGAESDSSHAGDPRPSLHVVRGVLAAFRGRRGTPRAIVPKTPLRRTAGRARRCPKTDVPFLVQGELGCRQMFSSAAANDSGALSWRTRRCIQLQALETRRRDDFDGRMCGGVPSATSPSSGQRHLNWSSTPRQLTAMGDWISKATRCVPAWIDFYGELTNDPSPQTSPPPITTVPRNG